jgi:hypothetical protein
LDYTEAGRLKSTISRIQSTFINNTKESKFTSKEKPKHKCPKCEFQYKLWNPERVSDHKQKSKWHWHYRFDKDNCDGSWSRGIDESRIKIIEISTFTTIINNSIFSLNDKVLVDWFKPRLKKYWQEGNGLIETKIILIEEKYIFRKDGSKYRSDILFTLENIPDKIPFCLLGESIIVI